ncbi:hypothetical protein FBU30_000630 [Linnemannia zychae]|nr:hypothetical protein FBU30_000630 [Linnemannia zychae]
MRSITAILALLSSTSALELPRRIPRADSPGSSPLPTRETIVASSIDSMTESMIKNQQQQSPVFRVTKSQLENTLYKTLNVDFDLQVISDSNPNSNVNSNLNTKNMDLRILGKTPVQITIHRLRLGGVTASRTDSLVMNEQRDPINYGNISPRQI